MARLLTLDDAGCLDAEVAGAKTARLARARRAGLPVLPGLVVPSGESAQVCELAVAGLESGGSGAARLAAMRAPVDQVLVSELARRLESLGTPVVVRSSSALEASGTWSGAFSSFLGVELDELATALRGVWSSVFSVHALELLRAAGMSPRQARLALLVQPELRADSGGVARLADGGAVEVTGTQGSPSALMNGWDEGVSARVDPGGAVHGDGAVAVLGADLVGEVAALTRAVAAELGDDLVEWAAASGRVVLLQSHRSAGRPSSPSPPVSSRALRVPVALRIARLAVRFPGPVGEALVLPWAVGSDLVPEPLAAPTPSADPAADLARAQRLARELTTSVWSCTKVSTAATAAVDTFAQLRGARPSSAMERLAQLGPCDPVGAAEVIELLNGVAEALVHAGLLANRELFWRYRLDEVAELARGAAGGPARRGPDRWEPYVHAVVAAHGSSRCGIPAAAGIGAGPLCVIADPHRPPQHGPRCVIAAVRPVPALAPLLWNAAALVTSAGSTGAHLIEVATSLGVPAVVQNDLEDLLGGRLTTSGIGPGVLAAIDGHTGMVSVVPATTDNEVRRQEGDHER